MAFFASKAAAAQTPFHGQLTPDLGMISVYDCVIVGAGMAGLTAGRTLQAQGWSVVILDKARGPGGRMATRRFGPEGLPPGVFDHGAQYVTATDPHFADWVATAEQAGHLKIWCGERAGEDVTKARYCGTTGMTAFPKALAAGLRIHYSQRVIQVLATAQGWQVIPEAGEPYTSRFLLLTAPVPQSVALLTASGLAVPPDLTAVTYSRCLTVMAYLSSASEIPAPGYVGDPPAPLVWIADNQQKGVSSAPTLTLQADPSFSLVHWDDIDDRIVEHLTQAAGRWLKDSCILMTQVQRWRYSLVTQPHPAPFAALATPHPLVLAGDGFAAGRVEGAFQSGQAAAAYLVSTSRAGQGESALGQSEPPTRS
ncbi:MAG: FAD-dependent oxidoreductase [Gloeomargaritaceae cyanobacterium C42_A2020_066]|nr:FAD-dependent oxidoreductase [Gloeomargaritaceae cyanobacterium C42_A2020_066]